MFSSTTQCVQFLDYSARRIPHCFQRGHTCDNRCVELSFPHFFSQIEIHKKKLSVADFKFKIEQIVSQLKIPVQVRHH